MSNAELPPKGCERVNFQCINFVKMLGKRERNVFSEDNRMLLKFYSKKFFKNLSLLMYISQLKISSGPLDCYVHNIRGNILLKKNYEVYKKVIKSTSPYWLRLFFLVSFGICIFLWLLSISSSPNVLLGYIHLVVHWRTAQMWLKTRHVNVFGMEMDHIWLF